MLYDLIEASVRQRRRRRRRWLRAGAAVALLAALTLTVTALWRGRARRSAPAAPPAETAAVEPVPVWPLGRIGFPTEQTGLLDGDPESVFMPTASGRVESALYGSTRTGRDGRPSFHMGVDIAPMRRDRSGRARDDVYAVADGRVGYINPHAGNSNYGVYVVLFHPDPLGEVYTLYAHMAHVDPDLSQGRTVSAGARLGRMGRTPARIVPVARSHVHFEIGLKANRRFAAWLEARAIPSPHGAGHGWNLMGLDPLAVWAAQARAGETFTLQSHVSSIPAAVTLALRSSGPPDFFQRYPSLWEGEPTAFAGPALAVSLCAGGVPLRGRVATDAETARLARETAVVLDVETDVLGRNGRRLVARSGGAWRLSSSGRQWVDIFLF